MASHRHEQRTAGRRCAVQMLYTSELQNTPVSELLENGLVLVESETETQGTLPEYALELVRGVEAHSEEIDRVLESAVENWTVARMPVVDRSILRVAIYEMLHEDRVPISVTINEAVELAKSFGGEDESPRFANGVLGRISQQIEAEQAASSDQESVEPNPAEEVVSESAAMVAADSTLGEGTAPAETSETDPVDA